MLERPLGLLGLAILVVGKGHGPFVNVRKVPRGAFPTGEACA